MVDEPDAMAIEELRSGRSGTVFEIHLAPGDVGQVVGRQGRTVRALRTLLEVRGERDRRHYELEVVES